MRGWAGVGLAREWGVDVIGSDGGVGVLHICDVGVAVRSSSSSIALRSMGSCVSSSGCIGSSEHLELK